MADPVDEGRPDQAISGYGALIKMNILLYFKGHKTKGYDVKNKIMLGVGCILLVAGGLMSTQTPTASAAQQEQCRQALQSSGRAVPELLAKCSEPAFIAMISARDARSVAEQISAANRSEVGSSTLGMFCLGMGIALLAGGAFRMFAARRKTAA